MKDEEDSTLRCLRCKGFLGSTGQEVYRYECQKCGQNYYMVMQLVPVESGTAPLLETPLAKRSSGTD